MLGLPDGLLVFLCPLGLSLVFLLTIEAITRGEAEDRSEAKVFARRRKASARNTWTSAPARQADAPHDRDSPSEGWKSPWAR